MFGIPPISYPNMTRNIYDRFTSPYETAASQPLPLLRALRGSLRQAAREGPERDHSLRAALGPGCARGARQAPPCHLPGHVHYAGSVLPAERDYSSWVIARYSRECRMGPYGSNWHLL